MGEVHSATTTMHREQPARKLIFLRSVGCDRSLNNGGNSMLVASLSGKRLYYAADSLDLCASHTFATRITETKTELYYMRNESCRIGMCLIPASPRSRNMSNLGIWSKVFQNVISLWREHPRRFSFSFSGYFKFVYDMFRYTWLNVSPYKLPDGFLSYLVLGVGVNN
jgi:hypothetical protein